MASEADVVRGNAEPPSKRVRATDASFLSVHGSPRLGLGLAALGRPGYITLGRDRDLASPEERSPEVLRARAWEVLDAAWALGIRYFDCARSYGRSEEFLSSWLADRGYTKEEVAVGSKWGYRYTANWQVDTNGEPHEVKDHSLTHLQSQVVETDRLLGQHLWLHQIHSATLESGVLDDPAVLDRLVELKQEKGWRIGLSLSGVKQAETLDKALQTGIFDAVQATWNLLEQSAGPALVRARSAGMQVIIKEALANGRLLRKPSLVAAAERLRTTPDSLALAAAMAQPFEPMVLSGAVTVAQLNTNFDAVGLVNDLLGHERATLDNLSQDLCMEPSEYWKERSDLGWN